MLAEWRSYAELRLRPWAERYRHASKREQLLVVLMATLLGGFLIYLLIAGPWRYSHRARAALAQEQATWNLLQQNAETIRALNAARLAKTGQDTSLLSLASKTAGEHELQLMRYTPNTYGGLALWLTEADFTVVLRWLDQLVQQYAIRIDHLVITPSTKLGTVEVQVVLKQ